MITLAGSEFIAALFQGTAMPANLYFGLSSTVPSWESLFITEPTDANYVRQAVPSTALGWTGVADKAADLAGITYHAGQVGAVSDIVFPPPVADGGVQLALLLFDAITGGNLLIITDLDQAVPPVYTAGSTFTVAAPVALHAFLGEPV